MTVAFFALFTAALAWHVYQLVRSPRLPNWAVTVTIAAFALAFLVQQREVTTWFDGLTAPGGARLANNVLLACGVCALLIFFLGCALGPHQVRRVALELVPPTVAIAVMTFAPATTPVPLRGAALGPDTVHEPGIAWFYFGGGAYLIYAITAYAVWIARYQRVADPHLRTGLRIGAASLVAAATGSVVRALYLVVAWVFDVTLPALLWLSVPLVVLGSVLFLAGITYPGVRARVAAVVRRRRHRADHHRLPPLWTRLVAAYPSIVLRTPGNGRRDRFAVHRRYYRRVIEIRDGLVQLSPYLETNLASLAADDPSAAAAALRGALARQASGEASDGGPSSCCRPAGADLESDVRPLLSLSATLAGKES
ncbi:MAB_1171c family putative transporter [Amycolatopsis sp. NPDC023774]|uniref:MAB_1171c family putative transporter n=1 Tax=Amycolatopsis sp. NPDC023774 TaxID=3155015 RepID=UPI00340F4D04